MSIFSAITNHNIYSLAEAFGATDQTSAAMRDAIKDWTALYYNKAKTKTEDPCQQIAYTIVRKLTKTTFGEVKVTSEDEYVERVLDSLSKQRKAGLGQAMIGGTAWLKPFPTVDRKGWNWTVVPRSNALIFGRDFDGTVNDIGTCEQTTVGNLYYTLLERRTADGNGYLTIRYRLFQSKTEGTLGVQVPLATLERYQDLPDEYTYTRPLGLGMVEVKMPIVNDIDGSDDGVSVYSAATGLIHNINHNEAQINTEFDNGKSRIFVSDDLLDYGDEEDITESEDEEHAITAAQFADAQRCAKFQDDIYVGIDGAPEDVPVTIFSPALREASFLARKQDYLRDVESVIGLKRGLLSEVEAVDRTATEVTSSEGDYALTIVDLQETWESAVDRACILCGALGQLYKVEGAHDVDPESISIDWGNGVLYDEEKAWEDMKDMVARGLLRPEYAMGWRFDMPHETPDDYVKIRARLMPELRQLAEGIEE